MANNSAKELLTGLSIGSRIRGFRKRGACSKNGCWEEVGYPGHLPVIKGFPRNYRIFCLVQNVLSKSRTMKIFPEYPGFRDIRVRNIVVKGIS